MYLIRGLNDGKEKAVEKIACPLSHTVLVSDLFPSFENAGPVEEFSWDIDL